MYTEKTVIDQIRADEKPYWYLYHNETQIKRNREVDDVEESLRLLSEELSQLPSGTYKIKAANHLKQHNGAKWYDVEITTKTRQPTKTMSTGQSSNAFGIPDVVYKQIVEETERNLMFRQMYDRFNSFMEDWPRIKKMVEEMHKDFYDDADGNGIPDFAETAGKIASAAESASTVKKVFTGSGLFS